MKIKLLSSISFFIIFCLSLGVHAQFQNGIWVGKEANNWYFGNYAGVNFNTTPPTALTNGQLGGPNNIPQQEGVGSISDADGNLLFYTNGLSVWNAQHQVMENGFGLNGDNSTSQSGLIVPQPETNRYYIFTMDDECSDSFLFYTIVDMDLQGGLGEVVEKNTQLTSFPISEHLSTTFHADKERIWLTAHKGNRADGCDFISTNEFVSFLMSNTGISTTPVSSFAGELVNNSYGQMKISPNGKKLAVTNSIFYFDQTLSKSIELFDFDNSTGEVSNALNLTFLINTDTYGLEFSPNSNYLYVSTLYGNERIYQFDISSNDASEILNSSTTINNVGTMVDAFFALQLGPDGKIYQVNRSGTSLSVINFPNNPGASSGYQLSQISLMNREGAYGLPGLISSYFESGILYNQGCIGEETQFSTIRIPGIDNIFWDFGDPNSGSQNTSTALEPTHIYESTGTYIVTAQIETNGVIQDISTEVVIVNLDVASPNNMKLCAPNDGSLYDFDLTEQNDIILNVQNPNGFDIIYYTAETDAENEVDFIQDPENFQSSGQTIFVRVNEINTNCYEIFSFDLILETGPVIPQLENIEACDSLPFSGFSTFDLTEQETIILGGQSNIQIAYYASQQEAEDQQDEISNPAAYTNLQNPQTVYIRATNQNTSCFSISEFEISVNQLDVLDTSYSINGNYPFNFTEIETQIPNDLEINYYLTEFDAQNEINEIVNAISFGDEDFTEVYIRATDNNGCSEISLLRLIENPIEDNDFVIPEGISPNGDGLNDFLDLEQLAQSNGGGALKVFNRYGRIVYQEKNYTNQWHGQDFNENRLPTGTYFYILNLNNESEDYGQILKSWVYLQL